MSAVTIKLSKPVKVDGQEVSELTLHAPKVEDMLDIGMPMVVSLDGDEPEVVFKAKVVAKYIVRLAGIQMSSVKQLELPDFMTLQGVVQGFFGRSDDAPLSSSPTESLSSPTSGE